MKNVTICNMEPILLVCFEQVLCGKFYQERQEVTSRCNKSWPLYHPIVHRHQPVPSVPLQSTSVDRFCLTKQGPGRSQQKRCMALFTRTATCGIHLEVVNDLSTDGFLNALSRFTSRRGTPQEMLSDNGTNSVGAVSGLNFTQSREMHSHLPISLARRMASSASYTRITEEQRHKTPSQS